MTKLLFTLLVILSSTAHAQLWLRNNFAASTLTSQDSTVVISGDLEKDVNWILIKESKDGKLVTVIVPTRGELNFRTKLFLRMGGGKYSLQILYSTSEERYNRQYYVAKTIEVENVDPRENVDSLEPTSLIQSDDSEIIDLKDSIISNLETDLEKTQAIHDWVASNISYDLELFMAGAIKEDDVDALTVLQKKKSVCEGYANLAIALNRAAGIPARLVRGEGITGRGAVFTNVMNHAWNEVLIDGKWMIQDTTWDAGYIDSMTRVFTFRLQQKYFNPDPAVFALDHKAMP